MNLDLNKTLTIIAIITAIGGPIFWGGFKISELTYEIKNLSNKFDAVNKLVNVHESRGNDLVEDVRTNSFEIKMIKGALSREGIRVLVDENKNFVAK